MPLAMNRRPAPRLRSGLVAVAAILGWQAAAPSVAAQELTIVREVDSDRYDPQRSTARGASEVLFMLGDTLVSLDYDMQTIQPGLAESWEVSEDGKTYTFHLRDDVTFCDGKKMTADDVVYTIKRWVDPATKSPVAWRAGKVDDVVATSPTTVEYRLKEPFSELLYQLTQSFATVIDQANVEALGENFGVQGFNGTGPFCWGEWQPRNIFRLTRHDAYQWGPPIYQNRGPAQIESITWQIVPEENTRGVAVMTGQSDVTQYVPYSMLAQMRSMPNVQVQRTDAAFWTYFMGFKVDKPMVDEEAVRRAMVMAVDQEAIAQNLYFGEVQPAHSYISEETLDWNPELEETLLKPDVDAANALLDEAGWEMGDDGFRYKDGEKLAPLAYGFTGSTWQRLTEAVQGDLRRIGVDLQIQLFDSTVYWGKVATQEFDVFGMSYPYVSAGDALNLYFRSQNVPTPNRMNWINDETDRLLDEGMAATDDATRAQAYGQVLRQVHDAAVWIPLYHEPLYLVGSSELEGLKPHNIYGCGLYKALDLKFKS
ncbi:ABC transporter substrate-binding protein [Marinivivus vitaminiproducens]|uniref:ABC transporter substrate-binding protein n=1 Tax=Marinivivus vitaminiproducens TaxID=3035935 RepID=UPI00279D5BB6|nr:ABC transporter substrate-binding protein [Geminicoccaceae bacterium SCSIO 64248]